MICVRVVESSAGGPVFMPIAVFALALAAFAIGTAEFIISGILPPLANDLGVDIPVAGLLVSAYALGVAIGGPLLTLWTSRFPPRTVIITVMVIFTIAQLLCAIAPDYGLLLAARLLSAGGHGVFFGAGGVMISRLVPFERRGKAFSLFIGGITVANLLGLPGGTAIGVAFGWRATFLAVAALGVIAAIALLLRLPATPPEGHQTNSIRDQLRALRHHRVWLSYITIALVMVGALVLGTYQVPMLIEITRVDPQLVPLYLLLAGVGSVLGIYAGGEATDWKPMPWLLGVLILQAILYFVIAAFSMYDKVWMAVSLFASGAVGFAFSTPLQARVIQAAHEAPELASSLISTAFNIGIAGGAALGALLLKSGVHLGDLPAVGSVTSLMAAAVAWLSWNLDKKEARQAAVA
jgi:DHA1 family inner membrane transport protein